MKKTYKFKVVSEREITYWEPHDKWLLWKNILVGGLVVFMFVAAGVWLTIMYPEDIPGEILWIGMTLIVICGVVYHAKDEWTNGRFYDFVRDHEKIK